MDKFNWMKKACGLLLLCATTGVALPAQTFTTLHSFDGTDGAYPTAGLVQGTDGNFYGTTSGGGTNGHGTVFNITTNGRLTTLHSFDETDGNAPGAGLVQGTNGKFYGTAYYGGTGGCRGIGCGTIFSITPSGTLTTLNRFDSTDGALPEAGLVQGTNGNLYGTTDEGGANGNCGKYGCGTVFSITPSGTLTTLYNFCSQGGRMCTDGLNPQAGLVQATNGNFYGTTAYGGPNSAGTVFSITPSGTLTELHAFDSTDGDEPVAGLIQATNGDLYGTTMGGGANGDYGTVFTITPSGLLTTLYSFCSQGGSNCTDGYYPLAALVRATDGNFYGTTFSGGAYNGGTVFKITPSGTLTTLYNFCPGGGFCTDGASPDATLVQDTNGDFYGTTFGGGVAIDGTVFSLSVGLAPFVETLPVFGKVGTTVHILGTNLTGATSVTFNGTSASFTVKSQSEITTTVPVGATTGILQVVTPISTFLSNVPFRVRP